MDIIFQTLFPDVILTLIRKKSAPPQEYPDRAGLM
jgi:hypothetical protein